MKKRNLTRRELAASVDEQLGIPHSNASEIVNKVFAVMKETMASGESIKLVQFGTLTVKDKGQRQGRNPMTGQAMTITKRQMISFRPSKRIREMLNQVTGNR